MKKLCYPLLILLMVLFTQCEEVDPFVRFFTFQNNSSEDILLRISTNCADTLLPEDCIEAYGVYRAGQSTDVTYQLSFIEELLTNDVLTLFAYDYKMFAYTPFDSVRHNHLELRRYELTREWLEEHDWTVVYP